MTLTPETGDASRRQPAPSPSALDGLNTCGDWTVVSGLKVLVKRRSTVPLTGVAPAGPPEVERYSSPSAYVPGLTNWMLNGMSPVAVVMSMKAV